MAAPQGQWCKISERGFARWLDYQPEWKSNGKAKDMIVYYALWTGSTKITLVVGII